MKKLLIALAVPTTLAFVACERPENRDTDLDTTGPTAYGTDTYGTDRYGTDAPVNGERDAFPGRGEGELESNRDLGTDSFGVEAGAPGATATGAVGEGEAEMTDAQIVSQFETDLMSDPDLQAVATDVKLVAEGEDFVLRGTVATEDVGDAIEEYADELTDDRDVKNELTVAEDVVDADDVDLDDGIID